ncbi:hypothetical protein [Mesorhizobium sp. L-8-3]
MLVSIPPSLSVSSAVQRKGGEGLVHFYIDPKVMLS